VTLSPPQPTDLEPVLTDLGVAVARAADGMRTLIAAAEARRAPPASTFAALAADGLVLLVLAGEPDETELAALREALWPTLHAVAFYRLREGETLRRSHSGGARLAACAVRGTVVALRRREHVLSPESTREKFDANAKGWDDDPASPSYPHFRWMRRYVATFALPKTARRVLDFGCGAGWVGVEAALRTGAQLSAFDPSPQMVENTRRNARGAGVRDVDARVGFGEAPPFAGEAPFDVVISAGVISFSPDRERWLDGLAAMVESRGRLVIADLNPRSHGMKHRRRTKALVPIRELNAATADEVRAGLERRGFAARGRSDYQLSRPIPQLMHLNETKLGGLLSRPLVWLNAAASAGDGLTSGALDVLFDSWVLAFDRRD
jgi:2-polyprenyl-3-methyl-5-hydroxy-6-metoxy-1,4-benzoquinol methylase